MTLYSSRKHTDVRTCLDRIDALAIHPAEREQARIELARAESAVERMLGVVDELQQVLLMLREAFGTERERLS